MKSPFISCILVLTACVPLTSCGSDRPTVTNTTQSSVGQQLTDLDQARRQGIISNSEYNRLKRAIIKNND